MAHTHPALPCSPNTARTFRSSAYAGAGSPSTSVAGGSERQSKGNLLDRPMQVCTGSGDGQ
jgi:hypothetical protein